MTNSATSSTTVQILPSIKKVSGATVIDLVSESNANSKPKVGDQGDYVTANITDLLVIRNHDDVVDSGTRNTISSKMQCFSKVYPYHVQRL